MGSDGRDWMIDRAEHHAASEPEPEPVAEFLTAMSVDDLMRAALRLGTSVPAGSDVVKVAVDNSGQILAACGAIYVSGHDVHGALAALVARLDAEAVREAGWAAESQARLLAARPEARRVLTQERGWIVEREQRRLAAATERRGDPR